MDIRRGIPVMLLMVALGVLACGVPAQVPISTAERDIAIIGAEAEPEVPQASAAEDSPGNTTIDTAESSSDGAITEEPETSQGPSEHQLKLLANLPSRGAAPELYNDTWLNSEALRLADLRGKVVMVEFWTFG